MQDMSLAPAWVPFLVAAAASMAMGWLIVITKRWHGALTFDHTEGLQKFHASPTPRVGGIALLVGLVVAQLLAPELRGILLPCVLAGVPAFLMGLGEDVTRSVGVPYRLGATMLSGLIACLSTGYWLTSVDVPGIDLVFSTPFLAIPVTAVALAGVANAVNMIDGFNGLAGGVSLIMLAGLGVIATSVGDHQLAWACVAVAAAVCGFLVVNFPSGKLFLGDGGAYFLGFVIAWFSVLLVERNPLSVSPWAGLMVCAYPVLEMFFSMWRKTRRDGHHMSQPDRLHLHMLLHCRVVPRFYRGRSDVFRNAATAPLCWMLAAVPACISVLASQSTIALVAGMGACAVGYAAIYKRLTQFRWGLASDSLRRTRIPG